MATITIGAGKSLEDYDKYLLSFLVENGYAKIESKIQITYGSYGTISKTYHFLFYSDKFKNKIQYYNVNENGESKTKPFIRLAHRKIISIDYKNHYEDSPMGMKRTFYSVVFSYSFVNDLSNLPSISRIFKGKGKAFNDPDEGTWKIEGPFENLGIKLDDNSSNEFSNDFRNNYEPFSFDIKIEYVNASHILFMFIDADSNATIKDAVKILACAKKGENFASLAKTYSMDNSTSEKGGDLGWFTRGKMVKSVEDAVFKAKVGEIIGLVRTQFGIHIIKVNAKESR